MEHGDIRAGVVDARDWIAVTPKPVIGNVCACITAKSSPYVLWEALNWAQAVLDDGFTRRIAERLAQDETYASAFRDELLDYAT
jgi:hypothetical protein